eukprot:1879545-Amphidinium_carterae.1
MMCPANPLNVWTLGISYLLRLAPGDTLRWFFPGQMHLVAVGAANVGNIWLDFDHNLRMYGQTSFAAPPF